MFKTVAASLDKNARPLDSEINKIPSFIFCRWLKNDPRTLNAANQFNLYYEIPMVNQWKMIQNSFAGRIKYIPWPKTEKIDDSLIIKYVQKEYSLSHEKALDYISLMSDSAIQKIKDKYKNYKGTL